MKLTPRQIEVLTEIFDGVEIDWRSMNSAQRNGRSRVIDGMRGWNVKNSVLEAKTREITLRGLRMLEPHYPDKAKITAAIEARRVLEDEREEAERLEKERRKVEEQERIARRRAKLVEGYRRILEHHHFDLTGKTDDLIYSVGAAIYDFEGAV
jgi:hypothetical protein